MITARHLEGYRFQLQAGEFGLVADQFPDSGGQGTGPVPGFIFLWAVAACFGQAVYHVARKMRLEVPDLALDVDGDKHPEEFRFRSVAIEIRARVPQAKLERAVNVAKKYCFVTKSLDPSVTLEFRVKGEEP